MEAPHRLSDLALRYVTDQSRIGNFAKTTAKSTRNDLLYFARQVGDKKPANLTKRDVEHYLEQQRTPGTQRKRFSDLRRFVAWMLDRGFINHDPTKGIKLARPARSLPRGLRSEWVGMVLGACDDERDEAMVSLMVQEGLRCIEISRLHTAGLDLLERIIQVVGKGGHERILPLSDESHYALTTYLKAHPISNGPVFRSYKHPDAAIGAHYVSERVSAIFKRAGVKQRAYDGRSAHALRHTCATDLLMNGAHLLDVQHVLGHASLETTRRYLPRTKAEDLRALMNGRNYRAASPGG